MKKFKITVVSEPYITTVEADTEDEATDIAVERALDNAGWTVTNCEEQKESEGS
jgi:hypothetical protein